MEITVSSFQLAELPADEQARVNAFHAELCRIKERIRDGDLTLEAAWKEAAAALGMNWKTIRGRWYEWLRRGIFALINGAQHPAFGKAFDGKIHEDTKAYYRRLCLDNQRNNGSPWKKICRQFRNGEPIPGVAADVDRLSLPPGWTQSNFSRFAPTPFEKKAARIGLKGAAAYRPLVFLSRREMYVFQEIMFDDVRHDLEVCKLGDRSQTGRINQLGALDVFSANYFAWLKKFRATRDDDSRVDLSPNEMIFLLAYILGRFGYNPRGTRLILEAGTASLKKSIREVTIELLRRISGGKITVEIGGVDSSPAFLGHYVGASKGNFRRRSMIESFHNPLHNETADREIFPGQTGSNARLNAPEQLVGQQRAQDELLAAMPALPEKVIVTLRQVFPEYHEACRAIDAVIERLNLRGSVPGTQHRIEGFVEGGLVTTDFDVPGVGLVSRADFEARLAGRSPDEQRTLMAVCKPIARKLSPHEVLKGQLSDLKRWRNDELAQLVYQARREKIETVSKSHEIVFQDKDISPEPMRFDAARLMPGDALEVVCSPLMPSVLWIYDARPSRRGAWLGLLRGGRASRVDHEAVKEQIENAERSKHRLLGGMADYAETVARRRAEDLEHNNAVLEEFASEKARSESQVEAEIDAALSRSVK